MSTAEVVILVALMALAGGLLLYWSVGLYRLVRTVRTLPTARAGIALSDRRPVELSVCVIVPAHNEAENIETVVRSLQEQDHAPVRFVLTLDRCTDQTAALARRAIGDDPRFGVFEVDSCPPDWTGKVHALWRTVRTVPAAMGSDLLLFADADTRLHPACVRATAALMRERDLDLLSLHSTLTTDRWFERLVQSAASFELIRQYPILRANRQVGRRPFANGQFMLFRRAAYEAIGGHAAARDELLEDIALSRRVHEHGLRGGLLLADGMLTCRMYRGWPEFRAGWKRIFTEAANRRPARLVRNAWWARAPSTLLPAAGVACAAYASIRLGEGPAPLAAWALGLAASGLAVWLGTLVMAHRLAGAPAWTSLAHPVGSWIVGSLLLEAARDLSAGRSTRWRGRTYLRQKR